MKKIVVLFCAAALVAAVSVFVYLQFAVPADLSSGARLFPAETMLYSGCPASLKTRTALSLTDFADELESLGLDAQESQRLDRWLNQVSGAHFGLIDFTLIPFSLNAVAVLEGDFDSGLINELPEDVAALFEKGSPYREVPVYTMTVPLNEMFQLDLFVTEPIEQRTLIAFSRSALRGTIDRLLDGGPSLLDNAEFTELTALPDIRNKDLITYTDTKAYFDTLFGLTRMVPVPVVQQGAQIVREELRMDEWGPAVSGQSMLKAGHAVSYCRFPTNSALYRQLEYTRPVDLSPVPADAMSVTAMQIRDGAEARQQLTAFAERILSRIAPLLPAGQLPSDLSATVELLLGFSLDELDPLLGDELMMWQSVGPDVVRQSADVFGIGIADEGAVRRFIEEKLVRPMALQVVEENGIATIAGVSQLAWSIQPERLLICGNASVLSSVLQSETKLPDLPRYQLMRKQLNGEFSWLQYADYSALPQVFDQLPGASFPPELFPMISLFDGLTMISGGVAEGGMLRSERFVDVDVTTDELREALRSVLELFGRPATGF